MSSKLHLYRCPWTRRGLLVSSCSVCIAVCYCDFANMHRDVSACTHLQFSWAHKNCCEWCLPNVQVARQTAQVVQVLLYMLLPCIEFHVPFIPSFFQCHLLCLWPHFKLLCGELEGSTDSTNSDWFLHPSTIHPWNSHLKFDRLLHLQLLLKGRQAPLSFGQALVLLGLATSISCLMLMTFCLMILIL